METKKESLGNQTQNGSNEKTSAAQATETVFNENNSTMEQNLNPSEDAQQQGGNVAAPVADGTKQAVEAASSDSDLGSSEGANGDFGDCEEDYTDLKLTLMLLKKRMQQK